MGFNIVFNIIVLLLVSSQMYLENQKPYTETDTTGYTVRFFRRSNDKSIFRGIPHPYDEISPEDANNMGSYYHYRGYYDKQGKIHFYKAILGDKALWELRYYYDSNGIINKFTSVSLDDPLENSNYTKNVITETVIDENGGMDTRIFHDGVLVWHQNPKGDLVYDAMDQIENQITTENNNTKDAFYEDAIKSHQGRGTVNKIKGIGNTLLIWLLKMPSWSFFLLLGVSIVLIFVKLNRHQKNK